jgi:hypothetical protein
MVLSNAKLLDSTRSKQDGWRQETNQASCHSNHGNNNQNNWSSNSSSKTHTGPHMVMELVNNTVTTPVDAIASTTNPTTSCDIF